MSIPAVAWPTPSRAGACAPTAAGRYPALLGKARRTACGSGGTFKDGVTGIQGEHCEPVMETLTRPGHRPKRAGG